MRDSSFFLTTHSRKVQVKKSFVLINYYLSNLEVQMYSSVFVDMSNFVKSRGVMPSDYHESEIVDIPKCFYAHWSGDEGEGKEDMIIMENLIPKGFAFINGAEVNNNKVEIIRVLA